MVNESSVKSSIEMPTFRPTMEEFANFAKFIKTIESQNHSMAKVSVYVYVQQIKILEYCVVSKCWLQQAILNITSNLFACESNSERHSV